METSGVCAVVPAGQAGFRPQVFGMGLHITDREVVTCAHVVDFALGAGWQRSGRPARLRICFPFHDRALCMEGTVDPDRWFPPGRSVNGEPADIAVIRLDEPSPVDVGRVLLAGYLPGAAVQVYGFRGATLADGSWRSHPDGEWAFGQVVGPQPGGRVQFDGQRTTGARVTRGFSGGAVYDPEQRAVVGMIVEADRDADTRIAQFIGVACLQRALGTGPVAPPPTVVFDSSLPRQGDNLFVGRLGLQELLLEHADA
ncbi:MAG: serine protease, partial [Actinobacteria bacterium]|nr:serine protease [Actinomycetota bacterium]